MKKYEVIFAIKGSKVSHYHEGKPVEYPVYEVERVQFEAENATEAIEKSRSKRQDIEDAFHSVKMLSLSATIGLPVPPYGTW
jgi:hypothetical protein